MRRLAIILAASAALALPAAAHARVVELGATPEGFPASSCPQSCTAIGAVTGLQVSNGAKSRPMRVSSQGNIVAFTVRLGRPNAEQRTFFENLFGKPARVRLSILRPVKGKKGLKLKRQSRRFEVERFFGSSPTFALPRPLPVGRRDEVAITTDTWAPILSVGRPSKEAWRSSRTMSRCDNVQTPAAHQAIGERRRYSCLHNTARVNYTATYVPDPTPTRRASR